MIKLKNKDVIYIGLHPTLYFALAVVECEFAFYGLDPVITALLDGTHNSGSIHAQGLAADIRWAPEQIPVEISDTLFFKIKNRLERRGFDVVDERKPQPGKVWTAPHMHIEFQPKPGETFWKYA